MPFGRCSTILSLKLYWGRWPEPTTAQIRKIQVLPLDTLRSMNLVSLQLQQIQFKKNSSKCELLLKPKKVEDKKRI
jgi:hypothetical protein